ncbi:MAG: threonine dehydratase, partial [Gaiellales bacterium]|nr:threonine dehydratase [Gaiellales bacterium]
MAAVVGLGDIQRARTVIHGVVAATPVLSAGAISRWAGTSVLLKAENLQRTGAFKLRGAVNRMSTLTPEERVRGVVAASAGNHAQGVALAATALGVSSRVYMPVDAPLAKQIATADYGAEVVLAGETFDESYAAARADVAEGRVLVPPFDDEAIIAGQGTIGLELLEQAPEADVIVVPLGGGGLLSGIAVAIKALRP